MTKNYWNTLNWRGEFWRPWETFAGGSVTLHTHSMVCKLSGGKLSFYTKASQH